MTSPFTQHYVGPLLRDPNILGGVDRIDAGATDLAVHSETARKQKLRTLLVTLDQPTTATEDALQDVAEYMVQLENKSPAAGLPANAVELDAEQLALQRAVGNKLAVVVYARSLDTLMAQCVQLEEEADWWEDVERSRLNVAWYLLQTLPTRLFGFSQLVLQKARNDARLHATPFTWDVFRQTLRPSLQPTILLSSLFPHYSSLATSPFVIPRPTPTSALQSSFNALTRWLHSLCKFVDTPITLARHECHSKKAQLRLLRDERARCLGLVSSKRPQLTAGLSRFADQTAESQFHDFARSLHSSIAANTEAKEHEQLTKPSRLVLLWPKLFLLPPLALYSTRLLYESRESLFDMALEAHDTIKAFVRGWLLDPMKDILDTVRARGDEGVIVRKEGVTADLESLERMTMTLAKEQLNYSPEELASLSTQVKLGDITPVLKLYENDIRSPLKSLQVDIDQALFGIDKLLKSQELTFAFVGVAPAFGIVYLLGGYLGNLWSARSRGRYGGKYKRVNTWFIMRRIERLLTMDSASHADAISPLTAGLLLVSIAQLRAYGETHLPKRSKLREGFLEDVEDLTNPELTGEQKRMVVERMWRSWGHVLEWGRN
ncbi:ATP synthase regulation protein NCA2-domain-containing protein [Mucidula mucida]|nr:ATP synthase regulation protein NCA2-domain-containing protein [Mucidula mucida]